MEREAVEVDLAEIPREVVSEILLDHLYLGSARAASNKALLRKLNIQYIVNTTSELPNFFEKSDASDQVKEEPFVYHKCGLEDDQDEDIQQHFQATHAIIGSLRRSLFFPVLFSLSSLLFCLSPSLMLLLGLLAHRSKSKRRGASSAGSLPRYSASLCDERQCKN
ncbi:Protein transport protein ssh1 [Balamuthia mandrillaris]